MINFVVQHDKNDGLEIEEMILLKQLIMSPYTSYQRMTLNDIQQGIGLGSANMQDIPVGTIEFVESYLNSEGGQGLNGYKHENPVEIPKYLRTEEFLKRDYKIVKGKDIVLAGNKFIKNVSKLKDGTYKGELLYYEQSMDKKPSGDTLYQLSSDFKPVSEYRVYVFRNNIEAIAHYDGRPDLFPDTKLLNKAVSLIMLNEKWLKSYTIDVMINKKGETALIEIHNFTSVGLYTTILGSGLPYAYIDGIDYLVNDNKVIEV